MSYSDEELEAMAAEFEHGITDEHLGDAAGAPGPRAWLLEFVDDWGAFAERARVEKITPEDLLRKAVNNYLHAA